MKIITLSNKKNLKYYYFKFYLNLNGNKKIRVEGVNLLILTFQSIRVNVNKSENVEG